VAVYDRYKGMTVVVSLYKGRPIRTCWLLAGAGYMSSCRSTCQYREPSSWSTGYCSLGLTECRSLPVVGYAIKWPNIGQ